MTFAVALHRPRPRSSGSSASPSSSCRNAMRRGPSRAAASSAASRTTPSWSCSTPACSSAPSPRSGSPTGPSSRPSAGSCSPSSSRARPCAGGASRPSATSGTPASSSCPASRSCAAAPTGVIPHPNYVAVVVEGFALPLVHTAWVTALVFTVANAALLTVRIRVENAALREIASPAALRRSRHVSADVIVIGGGPSASPPRCMPCARVSLPSSSSPGRARSTRRAARASCPVASRPSPTSGSTRPATTCAASATSPAVASPRPTSAAGPGRGVRRTALHDALRRGRRRGRHRGAPARGNRGDPGRRRRHGRTDDPRQRRARLSRRPGSSPPTGSTHRPAAPSASTATHGPHGRSTDRTRARCAATACGSTTASAPWGDHVEVHWGDARRGLRDAGGRRPRRSCRAQPSTGNPCPTALPSSHSCASVSAARRSSRRCAAPDRSGSARRAGSRGRVLLAGDASGYVDALTGEGISLGLAHARAAVAAVAAGDPAVLRARRGARRPGATRCSPTPSSR